MNLKQLVENLTSFGVPNDRLDVTKPNNLAWCMANIGKPVGGKPNKNVFAQTYHDVMKQLMNLWKKVA